MGFLNTATFPFTAPLEANWQTFLRDLRGLRREDFEPWPLRDAYAGAWLVYPLIAGVHSCHDQSIDYAAKQRRCPRSVAALSSIPGLIAAGFSWLDPGTHIYPHVDEKDPETMRAHLGLEVPPAARLRVGDTHGTWQEGRCLVFDGLIPHEVANESDVRRVVLLADFEIAGSQEQTA